MKCSFYVFIKTEKYRTQFLIETIKDLKENLKQLNITLFTFFDTPENSIPKIVSQFNIETIYTQKEFTQEEIKTLENKKKST